ncbi:MAG TPA: sigma-70 family RNA polymerase sigma factor [Blastocatellia bacterium]|nr:sigma-70 family RNA polymerase sigma factor [Blastocatellia bacterium]
MSPQSQQQLSTFEETALGYADQLFRVALRVLRQREPAEDLVQETFLQAWKSFHRFQPGTNLRAWLFKIMFNLYHSDLRRKKPQILPVEETIAETLAYDPPTPQFVTEAEVLAALERLPREFQLPVILADIEEFSYQEIAETMDIPKGTVMSRLHRGRKLLRQELISYARSYGLKVAEQ